MLKDLENYLRATSGKTVFAVFQHDGMVLQNKNPLSGLSNDDMSKYELAYVRDVSGMFENLRTSHDIVTRICFMLMSELPLDYTGVPLAVGDVIGIRNCYNAWNEMQYYLLGLYDVHHISNFVSDNVFDVRICEKKLSQ